MVKKKALIAMSGGVDSSVALYLMQQAGYDCIGVMMKLYESKNECSIATKTCCSLSDVEDARSVAIRLNVPFYVMNYEQEFEEKVIRKFVAEYQEGRTPNPCIDCNRYMKFDHLFQQGLSLGCDVIVTGHYASVHYNEQTQKYELSKGVDPSKDQSYVLYSLSQEQLAHIQFPLGSYTKEQIREIAIEHEFLNAKKPDSQDICFVEGGDYGSVIQQYTGNTISEGTFIDCQGNRLGTHQGYYNFTIGQRRGLGIAAAQPLYVIEIRPESNQVVLGQIEDLYVSEFKAAQVSWISGIEPDKELICTVRARYHQKETAAIVHKGENGLWIIKTDEAIRAVTKGQAVVFYQDQQVIGGGTLV